MNSRPARDPSPVILLYCQVSTEFDRDSRPLEHILVSFSRAPTKIFRLSFFPPILDFQTCLTRRPDTNRQIWKLIRPMTSARAGHAFVVILQTRCQRCGDAWIEETRTDRRNYQPADQ